MAKYLDYRIDSSYHNNRNINQHHNLNHNHNNQNGIHRIQVDYDYDDEEEEEEVKEKEAPKTLEDVLESVGGFGRFQILILLFILFYEIPAGMLAFLPVFVGRVPKIWKCDSEDGNLTLMNNEDICGCNGTRYSYAMTIVSEWDLICESSWVVDSITTFQMFGMFFGNTIPPQLSDWYGRKPTFIGIIFTMGIGQAGSALSINPYFFALSRFFCGVGLAGYMTLNGIYAMEFLTPDWRQLAGCLGPLGEGIMLLALLAYTIQPWRLLTWATTFPFITIFFIIPFLPESPRWLLKQGRIDEAEGVIRYIAGVNRRKVHSNSLEILEKIAKQEGNNNGSSSTSDSRFSYLDLFRRKELRGKTIIFIGIWFCWALQYFGISFNVKNFGVNPYLMIMLFGGMDAIGFRAALLVNNRLGRRTALVLFSGVSAIFFLSLGFIEVFLGFKGKFQTIFIVFVLLGKLGVAGARSSIRCLTVESYPVSIRTMGFGMARIAAALGGVAAPQLAYLGTIWPSVPLFTFAVLGLMGSLISLLLKETSGKPLQDDMSNADGIGNGKVAPVTEEKEKKKKKNWNGSSHFKNGIFKKREDKEKMNVKDKDEKKTKSKYHHHHKKQHRHEHHKQKPYTITRSKSV